MANRLEGKRVVVTQAKDFMGPAMAEFLAAEGAEVFADASDLRAPQAADALIDRVGHIDVLIANLMLLNPRDTILDTSDDAWRAMFDVMVHPLHRLTRAVLPQMMARRAGKIIVIGSANGLRGTTLRGAYSAARGAQLAYVRNVGFEMAPYRVNVNAIAQNWVTNATSLTPAITQAPEFAERLREVPLGRLAHGWESPAFAVYLASGEADFFYGQIFPFSGGWNS